MEHATFEPPKIILTDQQKQAVEMVKDNQVSILTGGPGTGKSTSCREILDWADESGLRVSLCAPSGKAAKRMSEVTGYPASTIHKLLEAQVDRTTGNFFFARDEDMPLECDLLICDETSMVSNDLMADLLRAVNPKRTKVLFVGDQDQLPSVGAGAVLRDFLASGVIPHVELNIIHRNSGAIVQACHEIKHGRMFTPPPELDLEKGWNFRHIEVRNESKALEIIRELVVERMPLRGYNSVWDVQVLSPMNERTSTSCRGVNDVLQEALNPNPKVEGWDFRVGDKVINIKNSAVDGINGEAEYIVNGDIGQVLDLTEKTARIRFFDPDRETTIPKLTSNLLLAYAITCHRFQGSETPVAIIPVFKSASFLLDRSWIYTAASRAKSLCITVGQMDAIEMAIGKESANVRLTRLKEQMWREWL